MGFQLLDAMWKHPILCASALLLLTPSLFHILLYFSPLLISTALFIVALVSMGPRMEETNQEREKWAKGEKPVDLASEETWDWISTSNSSSSTEDPSATTSSWVEMMERVKSKVAVCIDNMFKAGDVKPLVGDDIPGSNVSLDRESKKATEVSKISSDERNKIVTEVSKISEDSESRKAVVTEDGNISHLSPSTVVNNISASGASPEVIIKTVEVDVPKEENAPAVKAPEIDMPELEIVEVPSAEVKLAEIVAAVEALEEKSVDEPVWDVEPAQVVEEKSFPLTEEDVPLNEPVQEEVVVDLGEKLTTKVAEVTSPVACRSPKVVVQTSPPAASARDVHFRIYKDLQTQLSELEAKRRNKYSQVLSRRMSMKNNNGLGKKRDVELS